MKWSWKLGEIAGIGIYMHATFLIIIAWVALVHWTNERSIQAVLAGIGFILAIFGCVVLHELGHALAARRYGIRTRDITLLPIGGVARLERIPEEPRQEIVVAAAGPAVNVVIAIALWIWLLLTETLVPFDRLGVHFGPFLERLLVVNLFLVGFNLLPAFPMDGGRVLRALLALRMDYSRATRIAARAGQGMALLFGFLGLFANPFLLFIAFFVWIAASQEAAMVEIKSLFQDVEVRQAMISDFETLSPIDSLQKAIDLTLAGAQKDYPVVAGGQVLGVLTQGDLLAGLAKQGPSAAVKEAMRSEFEFLEANEMLSRGLERLQSCGCHTAPVKSRGELVGLLTMDNVGEFLSFQGALSEERAPLEPPAG